MKKDIRKSWTDLRKGEYPSVEVQLDMLYHLGYDGWRARIQKIKEQYPKPEDNL